MRSGTATRGSERSAGWGRRVSKVDPLDLESAVRVFPMLDARSLAKQNKATHEHLLEATEWAEQRARTAQGQLDSSYRAGFDHYLSPFAVQFARLRNVELGDLPTLTAVPELKALNVEVRRVGFTAVDGLAALAGGGFAGAAAGSLTFAAVGALATASTGAAISGLSGAAATSATLAWLGGGSLAAGGMGVAGGTAVLAGVVAAPALLVTFGVLWWKGAGDHRRQQELQQELLVAESELTVQIAKVDAATKRIKDTARVMDALVESGRPRLADLTTLIDGSADYAGYAAAERSLVAELAGLATVMAAVMASPVLDPDGQVRALSEETLVAAAALSTRLTA